MENFHNNVDLYLSKIQELSDLKLSNSDVKTPLKSLLASNGKHNMLKETQIETINSIIANN